MLASVPVTGEYTQWAYDAYERLKIARSTSELAEWTDLLLTHQYDEHKYDGSLFVIAAILRIMAMFEVEQDVRFFRWAVANNSDVIGEIWWEAVARAPLHLRRSRYGFVLEFELRTFLPALKVAQTGERGLGHHPAVNDNRYELRARDNNHG